KLYLSFCSNIFSSHPELSEELGYLDFRKYLGGNSTRHLGAQLFLGVHQATGTGAHCAGSYNLFFQIAGQKKWTFVHPDYLWLMYPMLERDFSFCASFLKKDYDEQYLNQYAPLQQYCPKYEAVLEPGDILLNPPWLWHAIDNLTDETIAVATRWVPLGIKRSNTFFDLMQFVSPRVWQERFYFLTQNSDEANVLERKTENFVKVNQDQLRQKNTMNTLEFDQWPQDYQF
ncbi:MAG: cupin-like domain-containing protein, partial [Waterburya sp.]